MANAYFYSNIAVPATLSGNINNSVTSCTVNLTTGWPSSFPYIVALDYGTANEELVKVTANAAGTLTIQRAFGGTSAVSHSTGAVVRHIYNGQDATDFRTHEQSTSGAHGIAGSFVGTTDLQTLTNKTLTSPSITGAALSSGGSMAGTFSGTPTFSGAIVLSGTPSISNGAALSGTFSGAHTYSGLVTMTASTTSLSVSGEIAHSNLFRGTRANDTDSQIEARKTGDANAKWFIRADGKQSWGPGTAAIDTDLFRAGASILGSTSTIQSAPTNTALDAFGANLPLGTSGDYLNLRINSSIQAAMAADGAWRIYGGNVPTSYTPTVANGGTVTWTDRTGYYWKMGKIVFVCIFLTVNAAGSGSGIVTVTTPSNIDRSTRQILGIHAETIGANGNATSASRGGEAVSFVGGSGAVIDRLRVDNTTENNILGNDLLAGGTITIQGWYREA